MAALLLVNERRRRKSRCFRQRTVHLDDLTDREVISRYRLNKAAIKELEELCRADLSPKTVRSQSIGSMTKVLIGLRFLAKGDFLSEVSDLHGVSKASGAVIVDEFISSVNARLNNIRFPTDRNDIIQLKRTFYQKSRIPNVIGAVDGALIPIEAPKENEAAYVCRKNFHALNVQAVCDTDMRFTDVVAMWPGSQHDSAIFDACGLKDYLERTGTGMLLGDSGYPLRRYLLTPKLNPTTQQEEEFNKYHSRGRMVIERAFGLLKSRFRCLHRTGGVLQFKPGKCGKVVLACMRLHNLCVNRGVPEPQGVIPEATESTPYILDNPGSEDGNLRDQIVRLF